MSMKQLMTEWRSYLKESIVKYPRVVLNEVVELTEAEMVQFPLSQEEFEEIKEWAGIDGEPKFLGSGTMGFAWQVGDKVLKLTSDYAEADAAIKVQDQTHPNVYEVYKVGKRKEAYKEEPNRRLVIICELIGDPNSKGRFPDPPMQDAIQYIHNSNNKVKYAWTSGFHQLMNRFRSTVEKNPDLLNSSQDQETLIRNIAKASEFDPQDTEAFVFAWIGVNGLYSSCFKSTDNFIACTNKPKFQYIDQVCSGLAFLKQNGVEFRDLKTTNVMLDADRLVIIDIGKSLVYDKKPIPTIE